MCQKSNPFRLENTEPIFPRDGQKEREVWGECIQPIVKRYGLTNSFGRPFRYQYFPDPELISEQQMHLMLRQTMDLCTDLPGDVFHREIMEKLFSGILEVPGTGGPR